jgi:hypothetical protein
VGLLYNISSMPRLEIGFTISSVGGGGFGQDDVADPGGHVIKPLHEHFCKRANNTNQGR